MNGEEFEIETGKIVEIKTLSTVPTSDTQVNDLLQEGWEVLDVKIVQLTAGKRMDGSPYVGTYAKVIWVLGRSEEE